MINLYNEVIEVLRQIISGQKKDGSDNDWRQLGGFMNGVILKLGLKGLKGIDFSRKKVRDE